MAELWSLRRPSWREWITRICRRNWGDEVSDTQPDSHYIIYLQYRRPFCSCFYLLKQFASTGFELGKTLLVSFQKILPQEVLALIAKQPVKETSRAAAGVALRRQR
jgi:hypothetical protein